MTAEVAMPTNRPQPCEVVVAEFVFGSKRCGRIAWHTLSDSNGFDRGICDQHLAEMHEVQT